LTNGYCDDGNTVSTDGCHNCVVTRLFTCSGEPSVCVNWCGDSVLRKNVGEICDNGNSTEDDGCFNNCTVNPKWTCTSVDGQLSVCTPKCGDGYLVGYELEEGYCDDRNSLSIDGCHNCRVSRNYICTGEPSRCTNVCGNRRLDILAQ